MRFGRLRERQHRAHVHVQFAVVHEFGAASQNFTRVPHGVGEPEEHRISMSSKLRRWLRTRGTLQSISGPGASSVTTSP